MNLAILVGACLMHSAALELDRNALVVDVDAWPAAASTLRIDAHVPLHRYEPAETYDDTFLGSVGLALAAKGLRLSDGVVLVSRSPRTALEAAELMKEHGYTRLYAVTAP